ncbi:MAG: hypothetical protein NVV63_11380 [Opitutus sp.]|nr:hypothetical protein [Opitutus sp.]
MRPVSGSSLLGDPRLDRAGRGASPLWNRSLLDRLQTPLTRYHD